ncbi:hypothetical protein [Methylobacterium dankookense]|uniref:hypothetical protein n=1 Tax=Methylobacterium dankookense TaxID=560405 RepID=UPI0011A1BB0C|nr:hypothetical protein [Methylobacterium dankookense]
MASASDSTRLPVSHQGPVTKAIAAMRREPEVVRRGALGLIAGALAASAVPVASAPSAIAFMCDWAVAHMDRINVLSRKEAWSDERVEAETVRFDAALTCAAEEPSRSLADIKAKARLILADRREDLTDVEAPDYERALLTLLREIIALRTVN